MNRITPQIALFLEITDWFIGTEMLVNSEFPLIFESISGICESEHKSFSYYNMEEIKAVLSYVRKILAPGNWKNRPVCCSDIGIVSPYRSQCDRIRAECIKAGYKDLMVGSAEHFQGQEKPIIIISTVRTDDGSLGFIKDPQVSPYLK